MNFKDLLNQYIEKLSCTSKEISQVSKLSSSLISRYRSGERTPKIKSKYFYSLINGIVLLAQRKNIKNLTKTEVEKNFLNALGNQNYDYEILRSNLNLLIETLKINVSDLSKYLGYDSSYLSKIRSGLRNPAHPEHFVDGFSNYILKYFSNSKNIISNLISVNQNMLKNDSYFVLNLKQWLCNNKENSINYMDNFFKQIDNFDLEEYISIIHFNDIKIPTIPFKFPKSKNYYGLEQMKQAELDFLKASCLSKSKDDVFMCSDMQMDDMAKDLDFSKKWMFGIAALLKKGVHLNIIHNLDRPFNEMMLGLESWIPIYMTGQISPYYFKTTENNIYSHLTYTSKDYSLSAESLKGHHSDGKYYLTSKNDENQYYKNKAKQLIKMSSSLMEIYREDNKKNFELFLELDKEALGERKRILSSLPLHTLNDSLILDLLNTNNINKSKSSQIIKCIKKEKKNINNILKNNILTDEFILLSKENFENNKLVLNLNKYFLNQEIIYNYNQYLEHFKQTQEFEKKNKNYRLNINSNIIFKNIDIYINKNNYVIISKRNKPNIHFVIRHQKMIEAIDNFVPPIIENKEKKDEKKYKN